jgi:hypothetical protein
MADEKPPMRFGVQQPRNPAGQFDRMPESPEEVLEQGGRPQGWVPGLGVGTAPAFRGKIPWPPAKAPPPPFRNLK